MAATKIVIVDDEPEALENCRRILAGSRYDCVIELDPRCALETIRREHPRVVLTDLRMPGLDGISLLKSAKQMDPTLTVILITAYASIHTAVDSMRHGAFEYLTKPFTRAELCEVIRRALGEDPDCGSHGGEAARPPVSERVMEGHRDEAVLVGTSAAIQAVRATVAQVAATEATVLITGERGSGKASVARALHAASPRHRMPFIVVDAALFEEGEMDEWLFGAAPRRAKGGRGTVGALASAGGGTLYLDEVGRLSLRLQAKVLRALKERRARPVDGTEFYSLDVRVMASSTQDLRAACGNGDFREDLYQYLSVATVAMPPLRQRVEDLDVLARVFLQPFVFPRGRRQSSAYTFTPEALELLRRYEWPGNLWELQQVAERAAALAQAPLIDVSCLPEPLQSL